MAYLKVFETDLEFFDPLYSYGFICDNKNNEEYGKKCSDYKVRYCCQHERESQWGR